VVAAGNSTVVGLGEEGTGGDGEAQSGGGGSPHPPCTGGSSGEAQNRRERLHVLELGVLRRARTGKQTAGIRRLGGRGRWCGSF
jgi:hypothetical protein